MKAMRRKRNPPPSFLFFKSYFFVSKESVPFLCEDRIYTYRRKKMSRSNIWSELESKLTIESSPVRSAPSSSPESESNDDESSSDPELVHNKKKVLPYTAEQITL